MEDNNHGREYTKTEIERLLTSIEGNTLGEVDIKHLFDINASGDKGIAGKIIEQSVLGRPVDTKQHPDIVVDGKDTEIKTTGIVKVLKKEEILYRAKEPMSVTAVSIDTIVEESFETSNFWHKLEHMLWVYYEYIYNKDIDENTGKRKAPDYRSFPIRGYQFVDIIDKSDIERFKNDWTIIRNYIKDAKDNLNNPESVYPYISEENRNKLMLINIAPKYPNPPRFRLKSKYVNSIIQEHFGKKVLESLPDEYATYEDIDKKLRALTDQYQGHTVLSLIDELNIEIDRKRLPYHIPKQINEQIVVKMFGGTARKISKLELFEKIALNAKSIVLTAKGARTEDMKLFTLDLEELFDKDLEGKFEESSFYEYFSSNQLLCIVYEEPNEEKNGIEIADGLSFDNIREDISFSQKGKTNLGNNKFIGFKRISFSDEFIDTEVKEIWEEIRDLLINNKLRESIEYDKNTNAPIYNKSGTIRKSINFPKAANHKVFVRGTGSDATNKSWTINGIEIYVQSIWIKGSYIAELLKDVDYI